MKIEITKASWMDAYRYAELKVQIWTECYKHILPEAYLNNISISKKAKQYETELQINNSIEYYFIIVSNHPAGVLRLEYFHNSVLGKSVCIKDLYLLPYYQIKGYGGYIFRFIKDEAVKNNCQSITAWIIEKNKRAEKLVLKLGFKPTTHVQTHAKTMSHLYEYRYEFI